MLSTSTTAAEEEVREISWAKLREVGELKQGEVQADGSLLVVSRTGATEKIELFTLEKPRISTLRYAFLGEVRYQNMHSGSYLEMWNHFPDDTAFFTRTLATTGPMKSLAGTSDWRTVVLPFFSEPGLGSPAKLVVNVNFTGSGKLWLSPLNLVQYEASEDPIATSVGTWWSDRTGGLIGGVGGSLLGLMGAAIGVLAGLGKARWLVMALVWAMMLLGVAMLVTGLVAVSLSQPYGVYYPLLLGGAIASIVPLASLPGIRRRYEQVELRRMSAMDMSADLS